ncbi:MAG TPA: hypothetical protein VG324_15360 [Blastocatellia bacterium]|nr:hypothetical protein [Blastocatellia bacterium]
MAATVAAKDESAAMEIPRQTIFSANAGNVKRSGENSHRVEFNNKAFELHTLNYESQVLQMAKSLDDRLHRSLTLAAIYRGISNSLLKKTTTTRESN